MTLSDSLQSTNYLDDVAFIAGTEFTLEFPIYNSGGGEFQVNGCSMKWALCPYGQPEINLLQKNGVISGSSAFTVTLSKEDTIDLGDIYTQQIEITDIAGKTIRPGQGIVIIKKAIPLT